MSVDSGAGVGVEVDDAVGLGIYLVGDREGASKWRLKYVGRSGPLQPLLGDVTAAAPVALSVSENIQISGSLWMYSLSTNGGCQL